jgi:hypothetical protein
MKNLIVLFILILATGSTFAQNKNAPKKPDIYFIEETFDFGQIASDKPVKHDFVFYNSGTAPLLLKDVKPSCHCTTPDWPKQPIKSKESAKISVTFDPKDDAGKVFNKSVTITTNIKEGDHTKIVTIYIKGKVAATK